MESLKESMEYEFRYRGILKEEKAVKVYTDKDSLNIEEEVSFDIEGSCHTSINYLTTALLSGILKSIVRVFRRKDCFLYDLEGKVRITLSNPLTILGVKGYEEPPFLSNCQITIYGYSDLEEQEFLLLCKEGLENSLIYNSCKNGFPIRVTFIQTL